MKRHLKAIFTLIVVVLILGLSGFVQAADTSGTYTSEKSTDIDEKTVEALRVANQYLNSLEKKYKDNIDAINKLAQDLYKQYQDKVVNDRKRIFETQYVPLLTFMYTILNDTALFIVKAAQENVSFQDRSGDDFQNLQTNINKELQVFDPNYSEKFVTKSGLYEHGKENFRTQNKEDIKKIFSADDLIAINNITRWQKGFNTTTNRTAPEWFTAYKPRDTKDKFQMICLQYAKNLFAANYQLLQYLSKAYQAIELASETAEVLEQINTWSSKTNTWLTDLEKELKEKPIDTIDTITSLAGAEEALFNYTEYINVLATIDPDHPLTKRNEIPHFQNELEEVRANIKAKENEGAEFETFIANKSTTLAAFKDAPRVAEQVKKLHDSIARSKKELVDLPEQAKFTTLKWQLDYGLKKLKEEQQKLNRRYNIPAADKNELAQKITDKERELKEYAQTLKAEQTALQQKINEETQEIQRLTDEAGPWMKKIKELATIIKTKTKALNDELYQAKYLQNNKSLAKAIEKKIASLEIYAREVENLRDQITPKKPATRDSSGHVTSPRYIDEEELLLR
jgi:hypothetical protein